MAEKFDIVIVGTGPTGLGAAFALTEARSDLRILIVDKAQVSSGGLRNDCKMNFTYPVGFPLDVWTEEQAAVYLPRVIEHLSPDIMGKHRIDLYRKRAERLGVTILEIDQCHLGTDGGLELIRRLVAELERRGVVVALGEELLSIDTATRTIKTDSRTADFDALLVAPGRQGFKFLQRLMDDLEVPYVDHIVDIGVRLETRVENYPIVGDYYDPKFLFPGKVRTFCTNSGNAHVVKERYLSRNGEPYFSVNGHAFAQRGAGIGLVNFAMLKTVRFTEPLASGQEFAENLGLQAMLMGGGQPIMQRVGDFRLGKRSKRDTFSGDLYDFEPTLASCTPGDVSLSMPAKIMRDIWRAMKYLDTVIPGVLHPSTTMYYPEIKLYANKPEFVDEHFRVRDGIYLAGDGAGTSRGITAAWASGIRASEGMLNKLSK